MFLTMKNAAQHLSAYEPTTRIFLDANLRSFKLFDKGYSQFTTNFLYIGKVSSLPSSHTYTERLNFVLIKDEELPAEFRDNHLVNLITIDEHFNLISIINDIQDFFAIREYIASSITKLLEALARSKSIQDILDLSHEILGNPLMLTDSTHYIVGHAGWGKELDEPEWQYYLTHGYISNEYALAISNDLDFRRKMTSDIVVPVIVKYENVLRHPQMISRVYAKGINIAYISVLAAHRTFSEVDFELVPIICDIISIIMQQSQEQLIVASSEIESFFIDIIKNEHDDKYIDEKASNYHLTFYDEISLICLDAGEIFDSAEKMFFVKSLMQNFFVGGISVIYNGKVLVLAESKHKNKLLFSKEKITSLSTLLASHDLSAGISRPFSRLSEIKPHYEQALNSLKTAQHLRHPGPIYFYEEYFLYYLVDSMLDHDNLRNICHPRLLEMIKKDYEKTSNYALSLYLYLQHNGDIKATSQAMHVHYNTLKYRLQKIAEIVEADLFDYNTLLKCKLTFLALEIYHKVSFVDFFELVSIPEETPYLV